jgi:hypothetical protein
MLCISMYKCKMYVKCYVSIKCEKVSASYQDTSYRKPVIVRYPVNKQSLGDFVAGKFLAGKFLNEERDLLFSYHRIAKACGQLLGPQAWT